VKAAKRPGRRHDGERSHTRIASSASTRSRSASRPQSDPLLARQLIERVVPPGELRARVLGGSAARLLGLD